MELIKEDGHLPLYFPLETLPTSGPVKAQGSLALIQPGAGGRGRIGGEGSLNLISMDTPLLNPSPLRRRIPRLQLAGPWRSGPGALT